MFSTLVVAFFLFTGIAFACAFPSRQSVSFEERKMLTCLYNGDFFDARLVFDESACDRYAELFDKCVILEDGVNRCEVMPWWSRVPLEHLELFYNAGWQLYVLDGDGGAERGSAVDEDVLGVCVSNQKVIYIDGTENGYRLALLHEMAHFVDLQAQVVSKYDETWIDIFFFFFYTFVPVGRFDDYATKDATEFFAEVYREGIMYEATMKQSAPKAYAYIFDGELLTHLHLKE